MCTSVGVRRLEILNGHFVTRNAQRSALRTELCAVFHSYDRVCRPYLGRPIGFRLQPAQIAVERLRLQCLKWFRSVPTTCALKHRLKLLQRALDSHTHCDVTQYTETGVGRSSFLRTLRSGCHQATS